MALVKPTTFTTLRDLVLNGVAVAKNTVLTAPQLRAIPHLDALVDRGWIKAEPDPHRRKSKNPRSTYSSQTMLKNRPS